MEFNQKLQELRKQKGLTQEELAEMLFVSRAAVSKWESGRGWPSIDSLKAISSLFSVSIDDLLSSDQLLTIAENDSNEKQRRLRELVCCMLDISSAILLFMPFFGQRNGAIINHVSLISLTDVSPFIKSIYLFAIMCMISNGIVSALFKYRNKYIISTVINIIAVMVFILSPQPYATALLFIFLVIKLLIFTKKQ